MAATATSAKPVKQARKPRPVVFESDATECRPLIRPGKHVNTDWGREEIRPVFAEFRPSERRDGTKVGRFVVTADEEDAREGFDMTREDLLKRLRGHGANRDNPRRVSADFWELRPQEYAPESSDTLARIARLAAAQNRDGLVQLLEEERATHERKAVLDTIDEALMLIDAPGVSSGAPGV